MRKETSTTWLVLLTLCVFIPAKAVQFTSCPPVNPDFAGICSEDCSSHSDCPEQTLCCSNGCGHSCTTPITIPFHTVSLVCPEVTSDTVGLCSEECNNCTGEELCCSNGCGHVCTKGVNPTPLCSSLRNEIMNSTLVGAYSPQCEEDGSFSPVQCHPSTGYCWCAAAESGQPVSDVTRFKMPQCNCSYGGKLYLAGERFDSLDDETCDICSCTVDGDVSCTERDCSDSAVGDSDSSNSDSNSSNSSSSDSDSGSDSDGESRVHYSCPAMRHNPNSGCNAECLTHSDCPSFLHCCYNGCGYGCMEPHIIPFIDLSNSTEDEDCPALYDVPCLGETEYDSCSNGESDCDDTERCCENDCGGAICVPRTPCFTAVDIANSSREGVRDYRPQCTTQGTFRKIQCHSYYCWCVDVMSGVPQSDIVPFEEMNVLPCTACTYNGLKYSNFESFPSGDGCNTCTCSGGTVSCSTVECVDDRGKDDDELWEWWHSVLIACIIVVVILVSVVLALLVGVMVLMKQNSTHKHRRLKEATSSEECELVEYRNGCDSPSIELKVPLDEATA